MIEINKETIESIEWEQKLLLAFAYSYNTEPDDPMASDNVYDFTVRILKDLKEQNKILWDLCTVAPEVFKDPEEAWLFTSCHFPKTEEIQKWVKERRIEVKAMNEDYNQRKLK